MKRAASNRARTIAPRSTGAAARVAPSRVDLVVGAAVFLVGVAVYVNTLGHGFVWDDTITLDQRIRFYRSPLDAFLEPPDIPGFPGVYRPLTFASFWVDQRLWWRNALGFHLTSVLLHALNGALVFLLCAPASDATRSRSGPTSRAGSTRWPSRT